MNYALKRYATKGMRLESSTTWEGQIEATARACLTPTRQVVRPWALQADDDSGCYSEEDKLARCQDPGGTVPLDQPVRDIRL